MKTGLDILLGSDKITKLTDKTITNEGYLLVDIKKIRPNLSQPRKNFDKDQLEQLSLSIKKQGLIMPILIRKDKSVEGQYIIIAGERRWRAAKLAGLDKIKAMLITSNEKKSSLLAIIENVQREDLTILEEAEAYNKLIKDYSMKHEDIAKNTGKSRSYITNLIRILGLHPKVKELLNSSKLSFGHARALLVSTNQEQMAKNIIENELNVREAEELIKQEKDKVIIKNNKKKPDKSKDSNILDYEKYLSVKLGYKVEIKDRSGKGYLLVKYKSLEQLDAIVDIFNK